MRFCVCHRGRLCGPLHPFGPAVISRHLEANGYKVGNYFAAGLERRCKHHRNWVSHALGFLVCAGNMDSMVNHYTVAKKRQKNGCVYAGRRHGKTPGLCNRGVLQSDPHERIKIRRLFIGGIEAEPTAAGPLRLLVG